MNSDAALLLKKLAIAYKKQIDREIARKKIKEELKAIKKISPKTIRKKIDLLKTKINEALEKERKILTIQTSEEVAHAHIKARLAEIDAKISEYIRLIKERELKVKKLEEKIEKTKAKEKEILELEAKLKALEAHAPEKVKELKSRLEKLK